MNVLSAVANLQKQADYYKKACEEMKEIIQQLVGNPPKGFEYIHPFDVCEMSQSLEDLISYPNGLIEFDGKKYKQSPYIPAKTKKYT